MCHARRIVSDEIWERYAADLPGRRPGAWGGFYPQYDNRTVLEAVLWVARTGAPWRDLPTEFGPWNTIYQRFHRWCQDGVCDDGWFARLTADLEPDLDTVMVDGTFVKVHQHGTGAPKRTPSRRRCSPSQVKPTRRRQRARLRVKLQIENAQRRVARRRGFVNAESHRTRQDHPPIWKLAVPTPRSATEPSASSQRRRNTA